MKSPVKLYLRVRLPDDSYRYLKPAFSSNGRIRPHHAIYDGRAIHFPGSSYNLRYPIGAKRVWETIGDDPSVAMDRLREKAFEFEAAALGKAELPTPPTPKPSSPLVAECIADFIEETTLTKNLHIERKCYQFWPTRYWAAWFTAESEPSSPLPYRSRRSAQHAQRRTTLSRALEDPLKGR